MKQIIIVLMLLCPIFAQAQKVVHDKKTNDVTVDKVKSFNLFREGCTFSKPECYFEIKDVEDKRVIRITYKAYRDATTITQYNPQGVVGYYEFVFLDSKQKAQTQMMPGKPQKAAEYIVKNRLFVNGKLDSKAVDEFVLIQGNRFEGR